MAAQAQDRNRRAEPPDPAATVLLTVECQRAVVGPDSALPELAAQARASGALTRIARLVAAAHATGVQRSCTPSPNAAPTAVPPPTARPRRSRSPRRTSSYDGYCTGCHPSMGTGLDALLRNLGCRTLIVTRVSANVAIPNAVFDAVNRGHRVVAPADAVAGVPADYVPAMIRHTLALVATVTTTDEILSRLGHRR
ncbi:isochorismatase family protein [Streptomyces sp. NPDC093252]|uniref:isochorismatase family protein n=1 Tax=Streptomyces sp. NPDC093252 TaxID=3154980 RepID=UPI003419056E